MVISPISGSDQLVHAPKNRKLSDILLAFKEGTMDIEMAEQELNLLSIQQISDFAAIDTSRQLRSGVPEVVYGDTKDPADAAVIALAMVEKNGYALVTRAGKDIMEAIHDLLDSRDQDLNIVFNTRGKTILMTKNDFVFDNSGGVVGLITAGTSDIPVAEEAKETCRIMGCQVITSYDVGISGIHRLFQPLKDILEANASVIIVVAGMEGALPSVVSSLVNIPVIGVPSSVGYGFGGKGKAALMSMLQSCAPGLVVVNIDNGFGAGVGASLIARNQCKERSRVKKG